MQYFQLDKEEKKILKNLSQGDFIEVEHADAERKRYQAYARASFNKTRNINIRIAERDLHKLKSLALVRGIPYQTLATSILHQFSNERIKAL